MSYPTTIEPFSIKTDADQVISGEAHTIPVVPAFIVVLDHIPKQEVVSSVIVLGFVEVTFPPGPNQFQVNYFNGVITFHLSNAGTVISVSYVSIGEDVIASHVNELQTRWAQIATTLGLNPQGSLVDVVTRLAVSLKNDGTFKPNTVEREDLVDDAVGKDEVEDVVDVNKLGDEHIRTTAGVQETKIEAGFLMPDTTVPADTASNLLVRLGMIANRLKDIIGVGVGWKDTIPRTLKQLWDEVSGARDSSVYGLQVSLDARIELGDTEVQTARGTQPSLDARLDVSLNEDGTLKTTLRPDVQEDGVDVVTDPTDISFNHGLDVTAGGPGVVNIAVDETEFTVHSISQPVVIDDAVEADTLDTLTGSTTIVNNLNRIRSRIKSIIGVGTSWLDALPATLKSLYDEIFAARSSSVYGSFGSLDARIEAPEAEIQTARGTQPSLDARLDVSLNEDGTLKTTLRPDVQEDGVDVVVDPTDISFNHGLDVSAGGPGVVNVAVDETEFTVHSISQPVVKDEAVEADTLDTLTGSTTIVNNLNRIRSRIKSIIGVGTSWLDVLPATLKSLYDEIFAARSSATYGSFGSLDARIEAPELEIFAARGTQPSLDARLDVALNEDGTLKTANRADVQEDGIDVVVDPTDISFNHGLDVTAGGPGIVNVAVDETEFTIHSITQTVVKDEAVEADTLDTLTGSTTIVNNLNRIRSRIKSIIGVGTSWLDALPATLKSLYDEIFAARGTQPSLDARLDVSLNEDGTLKTALRVDIQEDGVDIVTDPSDVNFTHGLDVSSPGGGVATVAVDETEFTIHSITQTVVKDEAVEADTLDTLTGSTTIVNNLNRIRSRIKSIIGVGGSWLDVLPATLKSLYDEIFAARGTQVSLDARLDVSVNEDGTLKYRAVPDLRPTQLNLTQVQIATGQYYIDPTSPIFLGVAVTATITGFGTIPGGQSRKDIVSLDATGAAVITQGVAAVSPTIPAIPSTVMPVALLTINSTGITAMQDIRPLLNLGGSGTGSGSLTRRQTFIAAGGETLFNLNFNYVVGDNSLLVFRGGMLMSVGIDYTETSVSSVTLSIAAGVGEVIVFMVSPGGGGTTRFEQSFTAATVVTVDHNLGVTPVVMVFDNSVPPQMIQGQIEAPTNDQIVVTFLTATSGRVICVAGSSGVASVALTGLTAAVPLSSFQVVYKNGVAGQVDLASASAEATMPARGITVNQASTGQSVSLLEVGKLTNPAWVFPVGVDIYVSETSGFVTDVAPTGISGSGKVVQRVGFTVSANTIFFNFMGERVVL